MAVHRNWIFIFILLLHLGPYVTADQGNDEDQTAWDPHMEARNLGIGPTPVPVGNEFQINSYTSGSQRNTSIAMGADGDFVVVWQSDGSSGDDTDYGSIQGQRFSSNGLPKGGEFQINSYTTSNQYRPAVAVADNGSFVVVWGGYSAPDYSGSSVHGQRFNSDGTAAGNQFLVNTYTTFEQSDPAVWTEPDGDFMVTWTSFFSDSDDYQSVQAQRYASDGTARGNQFQINTHTTDYQFEASAALQPNGDFFVVWTSFDAVGDDSIGSIQGQQFNSDGLPVGGEFQINSYTFEDQRYPSVARTSNNEFVVVWQSFGSSGTDSDLSSIQGQRLASNGTAVGSEFQVNSYTTDRQRLPQVAPMPNGGFVVVWQSRGSNGSDNSYESIQGRHFASDGSAVASEFQINTYTFSSQGQPSLATAPNGDFVVAWQSFGSDGSDTSLGSIQGQRFASVIFADGFESGNTAAWSSTVP